MHWSAKEWHKVTKGKEDTYLSLTIFICIACGAKSKNAISDIEFRTM